MAKILLESSGITALLQMSHAWDSLSESERQMLVQEGLFVLETLQSTPEEIWEYASQEKRQQIFLEAWLCYARVSNLNWVPTN